MESGFWKMALAEEHKKMAWKNGICYASWIVLVSASSVWPFWFSYEFLVPDETSSTWA
jgi:hypothetical protein